jgi:hypothetical protein
MPRRLAALVALALVPVAAGGTAAEPRSLFPIANGNRWTLRDVDSGLPETISILNGVSGLELYGFPGLTDGTRLRRKGTDVQVWEASRARWVTLLRFGASGTRYGVDLAATTLWRSVQVRVVSTQATVRDFRGRVHHGCTRFAFHYRGLADSGLIDLAFAPGLGFVRVSEQSLGGPHKSLLDSARIR